MDRHDTNKPFLREIDRDDLRADGMSESEIDDCFDRSSALLAESPAPRPKNEYLVAEKKWRKELFLEKRSTTVPLLSFLLPSLINHQEFFRHESNQYTAFLATVDGREDVDTLDLDEAFKAALKDPKKWKLHLAPDPDTLPLIPYSKCCRECKAWHWMNDFAKDSSRPDHRASTCKTCKAREAKKRRSAEGRENFLDDNEFMPKDEFVALLDLLRIDWRESGSNGSVNIMQADMDRAAFDRIVHMKSGLPLSVYRGEADRARETAKRYYLNYRTISLKAFDAQLCKLSKNDPAAFSSLDPTFDVTVPNIEQHLQN